MEEANYLWLIRNNGFTGMLMQSWVKYLRYIMLSGCFHTKYKRLKLRK